MLTYLTGAAMNVALALMADNPVSGLNWFAAGFCAALLLTSLIDRTISEGD